VPSSPLPIQSDGIQTISQAKRRVFTAYLPRPKGPVFMTMLERVFGRDIIKRTRRTVKKCAKA
jgi:hypothetical protein